MNTSSHFERAAIRTFIDELACYVNKMMFPTDDGSMEKINTALFAVSRQVSEEARDAFFDSPTVIIGGPGTYTLLDMDCTCLPFVRRIEFRKDRSLSLWPTRIFKKCSTKLKTITLARENLEENMTIRTYFG